MYVEIMNLVFENLKKIIYPEELLEIDNKLSKQEILILLLVDRHGEIIMTQLADYINIPMSTATGIVDRLVKKKYLLRERSEKDRRIVVLLLSENGKNIIDKIKNSISNYIETAFQGLSEEEQGTLIRLIGKLMNNFGKKGEEVRQAKNEIKEIDIL